MYQCRYNVQLANIQEEEGRAGTKDLGNNEQVELEGSEIGNSD